MRLATCVFSLAICAAQEGPLRFEVATVKPSKPEGGKGGLDILPGGGLRMGGVTLRMLISFAYDVPEERVSGGPKWVGSESYDIQGKPEHPTAEDRPKTVVAPGTKAWDRIRLRLQTLLAERFQLTIHKSASEVQGYALVVAKNGAKLKQAEGDAPPGTMRSRGQIEGRHGTMKMLASVLSNFTGRPVVDQTGLTAAYDYKLEYMQEGGPQDASSVFSALQEQLGLRLEKSKATIESIVVERAERPSAN